MHKYQYQSSKSLPLLIYAQIYNQTMKRKHAKEFQDLPQHQIIENDYSWTDTNVLKEKNRNSTLCLTPVQNQPYSKKLFLANKTLNSKIHKMPLHNDDSFLKVEQLTTQYKFHHARKKSNIQLLKREIQYLQQQSLGSQQFPKNDRSCYQFYAKNGQKLNENKNSLLLTRKPNEEAKQVIKGFIGGPLKSISTHSEQRLKRKWLRSNKKQASEEKQNRDIKKFFKHELMVPYRKYFPANRFRKNRSSTMKVDEILGKRVNRLTHFSIQHNTK